MPTVERLEVQYQSQLAEKAAADTRALHEVAAGMTAVGAATERQDQKLTRASQSFERLQASLDGNAAATRRITVAQEKYLRDLETIDAARRRGDIATDQEALRLKERLALRLNDVIGRTVAMGQATEARYAPAMTQMARTTNAAADASERATHAVRGLGIQSLDVFQQLASGAPVMMTLIQQGGQVAQVAAAGGVSLGQLAKGAAGAVLGINPLVLAGVAATAAVVGLGAASEISARQVNGLSVRLRATRDDFDSVARDIQAAAKVIAGSSGFSASDARAAGLAIANSAGFRGANGEIEALVRTAGDLAAVMGKTLPEAAQDMAQALHDPAAAAKRLADESFPGMSRALAYQIQLMADAGDKAGAQARYLEVLRNGIRGAADETTPLEKSLRDLGNAFTRTGADGRSLADALGSAITSAAASAVNAITSVVNGIEWLRQAASKPAASIPAAGGYAGTFGRVLTSDAGARGIFQLMPETAAGLKVNPDDANQNILGGLTYIQQLLGRHGGNVQAALRDYGGFVRKDPSGYIAQVQSADIGILNSRNVLNGSQTMTVSQAIEYWGQVLGLPPDVIALGKRIAVVESGGRQFETSGGASAAAALPVGPAFRGAEDASMARFATDTQRLRDQAFQAWLGSGTLSARQGQNRAEQDLFRNALGVTQDPEEIRRYTEALAKLRAEEAELITEQEKLARSAVDATKALAAQEGWSRRMAEIDQQFAVAARAAGQAVDQKALALAKAAEQTKLAREFEDLVAATNRSAEAQERITAAYDGTEQSIARATNRERALVEARARFDPKAADFAERVDDLARAYDRSTDASRAFQQAQQSVSAIMDTLSNAVDRLAQGMIDAFLSGSGAAVNFGNIVRSVAISVGSDLLKLAVLNPLKNDLLGGNLPTLSAGLGVLAGGNSGGGGMLGGGMLSNVSSALSVGRIGDALGITDISGALSSVGRYLGLTGDGGILSGVSNLLGAPLLGQAALTSATNSALAGLGAGVYGPATLGQVGFSGLSIGQALGGFGVGFSGGSLLGSVLQGALNKTGPAPTIGAGLGALAGVPLIPVLGPLAPIIGGLLGGAGGSLIGPRPATPFSATGLSVGADGMLSVGRTFSQIVSTSEELARLNEQVGQLNAIMSATGTRIVNATSRDEYGQMRLIDASTGQWANIGQGGGRPGSLGDMFGGLRFTSDNRYINTAIESRRFSSPEDLATTIAGFRAFLDQTAPALKAIADDKTTYGIGSLATSINTLREQFDAARAVAEQLGWAEYDLIDARERAVQAANDNATRQLVEADRALLSRKAMAEGLWEGDLQKQLNAVLWDFDADTQRQRQARRQDLLSVFGDAFEATEAFAREMTLLEETRGAERLAVAKSYLERIAEEEAQARAPTQAELQAQARAQAERQNAEQSALGVVTSLAEYARNLAFSDASPLSVQAQLDLADRAFRGASSAAAAGDFASMQQLPEISQTLLEVAREVYGSGAGYAQRFDEVRAALEAIVRKPPEEIIVAALKDASRENTQVLGSVLERILQVMTAVKAELQQQNLAPARARAA